MNEITGRFVSNRYYYSKIHERAAHFFIDIYNYYHEFSRKILFAGSNNIRTAIRFIILNFS